ncbi:MAG: diguanylate cyclase [Desulfarculus sp.]|nr:diguanylate cyclase [Desulfarculus sp.]
MAYEQILDALTQGLIVLDRELRVLLWNRWMEQHSRLERERVLGRVITEIYPELVKKGFVWKVESVFKLGNYAFFSQRLHRFLFPFPAANYLQNRYEFMQQNAVLAPLRGPEGRVDHVCVSIMDHTDTVMYQERLEESTKRLEQMSQTDHLTQVANRRHLFDRLSQELNLVRRNRQALSLAILDVDHFKKVNDTYGHLCGDQVLVQLAGMLKASLRAYDLVGRYGGEEFCLVLPNTNLEDAVALVERLRCQVAESEFQFGRLRLSITISAGVTCSQDQPPEVRADTLLSQADEALYRAKTSGRNQTELAACHLE